MKVERHQVLNEKLTAAPRNASEGITGRSDVQPCAGAAVSKPKDKQMKQETLIKIGNKFKAQMAAQYQLPELNAVNFAVSKVDGDNVLIKTDDVDVAPTGQLAGIINRLTARVEVATDGKHTHGSIHYRYEHHGRGSNGADQGFVIVTERYGERVEYVGAVNERLAYALENMKRE